MDKKAHFEKNNNLTAIYHIYSEISPWAYLANKIFSSEISPWAYARIKIFSSFKMRLKIHFCRNQDL
jgi:hypothetical protein